LSGDGRHDLGEPGLVGAVVTLDGGTPITTSGNGLITGTYAYLVTDAGSYVVAEQDPPGYRSTTPNAAHVPVPAPLGNLYEVNFGDTNRVDTTSIHGTVFDDQNVNTAWDPQEPGLAGVTVTLTGDAGGLPEAVVTNRWGQYTFLVAASGTYTLTEDDPSDYVSTNAIPGSTAVVRVDDNTLRAEVTALGVELGDNLFGDVLASAVVTISGTVWDDNGAGGTAGNGERDGSEPGLAGADVGLSSGMVATTGDDGTYTLYAPPNTVITVIETNPADYVSTGSWALGDGAARVDDDTLTVSGLGAGEISAGNLFGDVLPADLAVVKSAEPEPAVAGALLSYTLTYANSGPSYAQAVQVVDVLPAQVSYEGMISQPAGWEGPIYDASSHTLTWTASSLVPGASGAIVFAVRPAPDASGTLTNDVTIDSNMPDTTPGDNASQTITPIAAEADLTVSKTSADSVVAGTQLTYTLHVDNGGPSYAQGVVVTDTLPTGVELVDATDGYAQDGQTLVWDLGTLADDDSRTITVVVGVNSGVGGWITNTVEVAAGTFDPQAPNLVERAVYVGTVADLRIVKSSDPEGMVVAGTPLTYTLEIENAGSSDAQDVVVTDTLPAGVQLVEASGSYTQEGQQVVWQLGTLANSATETLVIVTEVDSDVLGWITNTAVVNSATYDPFDTNEAQVATWVDAEADLSIVKSATPDPVAGQGTLTYRLDYRNDGPSDAQQVCITDTLPEGVRHDGVSSQPGWAEPTYDAGPPASLTWCRDTVAADASGTITFEVTVLPGIGMLSNSVAIESETTDPNPGNNTPAPTETAIGCGADAYEEDDESTLAKELTPGVWQDHNFSDDSTDWLRFTAERGFKYTIQTSSWGQRADTFLSLYGPDGSTLLEANDDLEGTDDYSSQIVWQAPADDTYYVKVTNRAGLSGCYTEYRIVIELEAKYFLYLPVVVRNYAATPEVAVAAEAGTELEAEIGAPDDAGAAPGGDTESDVGIQGIIDHPCPDAYDVGTTDDTWETANPIVSGVSQLHSFDSDIAYFAADKDFVWFDLHAGQHITFTVTPVNGELPVLLELYDREGTALGISNAEGESQLAWQAPSAGRYYLSVTAWPESEVFGCDDAAKYHLLADRQPWWDLYLPIVLRSH